MELVKHETCQQYVARRLSEGWRIVRQQGYHLVLSSPDGNILRPVDLRNDVETLRPSAPGDLTDIPTQFPVSGAHWEKVDEVDADDASTYVKHFSYSLDYMVDLYNLPVSSGSGIINKITVYIRTWCDAFRPYSRAYIKSGETTEYGATHEALVDEWHTFSDDWATDPNTTEAWTWGAIDDLQIGVGLRCNPDGPDHRCTQVYVEVDYTPAAPPPPPPANPLIGKPLISPDIIKRAKIR